MSQRVEGKFSILANLTFDGWSSAKRSLSLENRNRAVYRVS